MSSSTLSGPVGVVPNDAKSGAKGEPMTPIPSATLVILCPISGATGKDGATEYATLMVRRKATGSFRSAEVFPGGLLDLADMHAVQQAKGGDGGQSSTLPAKQAELYLESLRLCALRETFEETGLLLIPAEGTEGTLHSRAVGPSEVGMTTEEWTAARKSVHDDARSFSSLLNRVQSRSSGWPKLAPLRHHSNWVTPRTLVRPAKRFDTHFFLTVLNKPDALGQLSSAASSRPGGAQTMAAGLTADGSETTSLRLAKPSELLTLAIRDEVILFPPQYYILADLDTTLRHGTGTTFAPLDFGNEREPEDKASSTSVYVTIPGVSSVEPHGQPSHGAMVARNRLSSKGGGQEKSDEEEQMFVLPLALPGDALRPVNGDPDSQQAQRNRVYVTPRGKNEGGGLLVHGAQRRGIKGLLDFQFGNIPAELEAESDDGSGNRQAKL